MSPTLKTAKAVARRAIKRPWRAHGLVLVYHRVATAKWDPWSLCVEPERFEQHLATLSGVADLVPLSELASRLRRGRRARPVVAITFDDAYADNLHAALPLLERRSVPATVFVPTGLIDRTEPFWWDRLSAILLSVEQLPLEVTLPIADEDFTWRRRTSDGDQAGDRDRLHLALWSRLVLATDSQRRAALDQLESLAAHTMTHCRLPDLPPSAQLEEIVGSRQQCREVIGEFPSSFAYPFGAHDGVTPELVRSAGFEHAYSTANDLVWDDSDAMLMPRVPVINYTVRELSARLRMKWLP
jgi:peptidoglycan/xylan/chitin deacetylase (PgdA/CDA1 family)